MSYRPNGGNRGRGGYVGGRGGSGSPARRQGGPPLGGGGGGYGGNQRGAPNGKRGRGRGSALAQTRFKKPAATQDTGKKNILEVIARDPRFRVTLKDAKTAYDHLSKFDNLDQNMFKKPETLLSPAQVTALMYQHIQNYEAAFRSRVTITQERFREYKTTLAGLLFKKTLPGVGITQEFLEKRAKVCTCLVQICGNLKLVRDANRYGRMWLTQFAPRLEITSRDIAALSQAFNLLIVQKCINPLKKLTSTKNGLPKGRRTPALVRRYTAQMDDLLFRYAYAEFDRWSNEETDPTQVKAPVSFSRLQREFVAVARRFTKLQKEETKELAKKPKEEEANAASAPKLNYPKWELKTAVKLDEEREKKRQEVKADREKRKEEAKKAKNAELKNAGRKAAEEVVAVSRKPKDWVKANDKSEIILTKAFESKNAGKLLFSEPPLVVKFTRGADRYCGNCYRVNRGVQAVKCAKDKCGVMFCGSLCAAAALPNGRHGECLCGDKYHGQSLDRHSHLILQLISMFGGSLANFLTMLRSAFSAQVNTQTKLADFLGSIIVKWAPAIHALQDHVPLNKSVLIDTCRLMKTLGKSAPAAAAGEEAAAQGSRGSQGSQGSQAPDDAAQLLYKMLIFLRNYPQSQISIQGRGGGGGKRKKGGKVSLDQNGKPTKVRPKTVPLGTALGSIGGVMAFSCDPVLRRSLNTATGRIEYRLAKANKLKEGDVLTVGYGLGQGRKRGQIGGQQYKYIMERFGIKCNCSVCGTIDGPTLSLNPLVPNEPQHEATPLGFFGKNVRSHEVVSFYNEEVDLFNEDHPTIITSDPDTTNEQSDLLRKAIESSLLHKDEESEEMEATVEMQPAPKADPRDWRTDLGHFTESLNERSSQSSDTLSINPSEESVENAAIDSHNAVRENPSDVLSQTKSLVGTPSSSRAQNLSKSKQPSEKEDK